MGFSEGLEDEFLLTCFVCKEPFGMLAAFCGGCGARRDQAMGVERARPSQQITQNQIQTAPLSQTITEMAESPFAGVAEPTEKAKKPVKKRKTSIRRQIFFSNIRLRIEVINQWQSRHARALNSIGSLLFLSVTYLFIQSFIVGTSNPELAAERYVKAAVVQDSEYFDINEELDSDENYPIFPVKYLKTVDSTKWLTSSDIRGLSGTAEVFVTPTGNNVDQRNIVLEMKATYVKTFGIFRKPVWAPAAPTATIKIEYPTSNNTLIYINGYLAGTTKNPAVKEGTYYIYPGALEITYYQDGEETGSGLDYFIQTSGNYE